ncbi:MAG: hypothetical protein DCF16_03820 [Alphaproteobacteria bacterium]|nr:MAG: hypothetical protein DCF16_03820 [Alphaproteobacteria bacterium]
MTIRAAFFAALLLAACASPAPAPAPTPPPAPAPMPEPYSQLGRQIHADIARLDAALREPGIVTAEIGQTADLGGGLTVRPLAIIEDSRCPQNVQCLWAGRMRIRAMVSGIDTELTLGEGYFQSARGVVQFEVASPGAWAEWPREELGPRPAYRFGFRRGG